MGGEIGALVDGGFQKFFRTPSGRKTGARGGTEGPARLRRGRAGGAREKSYYNESLGTVSTFYLYDRVKDRDRGVPKRVWE